MSTPPEQFKNDDAAYHLIDSYLKSLQDTGIDELVTHLKQQTQAFKLMQDGPTGKAVNTIRVLIEAQGGDPDELLLKRKQEDEAKK